MSQFQTIRPSTSSGGGGTRYSWKIDTFPINTAFAAGKSLALSHTPVNAESIVVWFQGNPQIMSPDWSYNAGTNSVILNFSADPAIDYPDTGVLTVFVQYPYTA